MQQFSVFDFSISNANDPERSFKLLQGFCGLHTPKKSADQFLKLHQIAVEALRNPNFKSRLAKKSDGADMKDYEYSV
jgi:hypothetical protein